MKFKFSLFILSLIACIAIWSCGPKKPGAGGEDKPNLDGTKPVNEGVKGIIYKIPPPSEIPFLLQSIGADFNQSLINDRKKSESYTQSDKGFLNLGTYAADIGYLIAYDKTQESIDYLTACKSLAETLGVSSFLDQETLKKFEANIGNKEALAELLNSAVKDTDKYLNDENRSKLGALLVTGSFVESLYISTAIIKSYPNDLPQDKKNLILTPLIQLVIKQKESTSEVIKMLSSVDQSGSIPTILTDLKNLEASYANSKLDEAISKQGNKPVSLTPAMLADVTKVIEKLRSDIVNIQ